MSLVKVHKKIDIVETEHSVYGFIQNRFRYKINFQNRRVEYYYYLGNSCKLFHYLMKVDSAKKRSHIFRSI